MYQGVKQTKSSAGFVARDEALFTLYLYLLQLQYSIIHYYHHHHHLKIIITKQYYHADKDSSRSKCGSVTNRCIKSHALFPRVALHVVLLKVQMNALLLSM